MKYKRFGSTIVVRIDRGEEILDKIRELALKENIKLASVTALGATNDFTVGVFNTAEKKYYANEFKGAFEIVSLTGTINTMDGEFYTHIHMSAGNEKGEVFGGHLNRAMVSATCGMDYDAKLVGYDADEDIAVLKLVQAEGLPVAEFGDSELAVVGDPVYAIGNPLGIELRGTLTEGIISAINRNVELDGRTLTVLQTTAALNNGNSGGPLINRYGQVIGINTLKMSGTGVPDEATVEGLGFALPISNACFVINDIIANGKFHGLPMLGIMVSTVETTDGATAFVCKCLSNQFFCFFQ